MYEPPKTAHPTARNSTKAAPERRLRWSWIPGAVGVLGIALFLAPAITFPKKENLGKIVDQQFAQVYFLCCTVAMAASAALFLVESMGRERVGLECGRSTSRSVAVIGSLIGTCICVSFVGGSLSSIEHMYRANDGTVADWWYVDALDHVHIFLAGAMFWLAAMIARAIANRPGD
tara:strand:- start:9391 stop:9915 length:525 start_codon:yes stop_codon:yes gene_type:complete